MGSITMRKVPMMERMISGRKRMRSATFRTGLAGIGGLRAERNGLNPEWHVDLGLLQDVSIHFADRRQEALRVDTHPHHHYDQRNGHGPLPQIHVGDVRL